MTHTVLCARPIKHSWYYVTLFSAEGTFWFDFLFFTAFLGLHKGRTKTGCIWAEAPVCFQPCSTAQKLIKTFLVKTNSSFVCLSSEGKGLLKNQDTCSTPATHLRASLQQQGSSQQSSPFTATLVQHWCGISFSLRETAPSCLCRPGPLQTETWPLAPKGSKTSHAGFCLGGETFQWENSTPELGETSKSPQLSFPMDYWTTLSFVGQRVCQRLQNCLQNHSKDQSVITAAHGRSSWEVVSKRKTRKITLLKQAVGIIHPVAHRTGKQHMQICTPKSYYFHARVQNINRFQAKLISIIIYCNEKGSYCMTDGICFVSHAR